MGQVIGALLLGASLTMAVLWPRDPLLALAFAPVGGSCLALLAGVIRAWWARPRMDRPVRTFGLVRKG